ncbi:uncharacterized protein G2W53_009692 [Senna tora]|uniref:Uncharacterized protein n=1 Tax=Senna tora TaxID=362788 RepID=A0A834WYN0_9FABA|nr:uncharacterized protein G2W53_009692 [Senna tora]
MDKGKKIMVSEKPNPWDQEDYFEVRTKEADEDEEEEASHPIMSQ